jgi:hypothetical protein
MKKHIFGPCYFKNKDFFKILTTNDDLKINYQSLENSYFQKQRSIKKCKKQQKFKILIKNRKKNQNSIHFRFE